MGLSQQQVAAQLGISQGYVSELETGKASLALTRVFDIMRLAAMTIQAEIPESRLMASLEVHVYEIHIGDLVGNSCRDFDFVATSTAVDRWGWRHRPVGRRSGPDR